MTNWGADDLFLKRLEKKLKEKEGSEIAFNKKIKKLKEAIPLQAGDGNQQISLEMIENKQFLGGLCFADDSQVSDRKEKFAERIKPTFDENKELRKKGKRLKKMPSFVVLGNPTGTRIGFTEGKQPYRTNRPFENDGSNLFFLMDTRFHKMHTSQCLSGVPPKRGHIVSDLDAKGKMLIMGYSIAHSLAGSVPDQFNQYDMWLPEGTSGQIDKLWDLSCAFMFAQNSCIECEIPKEHPTEDCERAYVVNPLSPNRGTFWQSKILPLVKQTKVETAKKTIDATTSLYSGWQKWCADHPSYRAKANLPIYQHSRNKIPGDGWGIYQIEQEIKLMPDEANLQKLSNSRKEAVKELKAAVVKLISEMGYWGN
ncbi:MAG: hypothetical protein IPK04_15985 [Bdellovibrionales bacterium]|nr:hypothetical protein [Bdellovibrionales bacterium]